MTNRIRSQCFITGRRSLLAAFTNNESFSDFPQTLSFNQLDLPEYDSYEQLRAALIMAITEASEGFGFG